MSRKMQVILIISLITSVVLNGYFLIRFGGIKEQGAKSIRIKIGTMKAFSYLPLHVAYVLGYFKEEGLDVEMVFFGSGSKNREALIAGDVDFATLATVHVLIARSKGRPIKVIGALQKMEFFDVVVRSDLRDKVRSLRDLKGMKIGISKPGSGSWAWCIVYLKKVGLDPDRDVELVSVNGITTMYAALKAKRVDAVIAWNPLIVKALKEGVGYVLLSIHDKDTHIKYIGSEEAHAAVLATREEIVREKPGIVLRIIKAINKGLHFIHTHSPEEVAKVVSSLYEGLELDILAKAIEYEMPTYPSNLSVSESAFNIEVEVYLNVGIIDKRIDYYEAVEWGIPGWRP